MGNEMKKLLISRCFDCPYLDTIEDNYCCHKLARVIVADVLRVIPHWCPLPEEIEEVK
jgi:hypothetical protein